MATDAREQVRAAMEKMGSRIPPGKRQMAEDAFVKILEGTPPAVALGFTPDMLDAIYKYGYNQFQAGKYQDALNVFSFLRQFDASNYHYSFAIGACHQYLKQYEEAGANYIICAHLDRLNPIPYFHLYECFMRLDQPLPALHAIQEAVRLAEMHPHYDDLKEKALLEYKTLKKDIKKYLKENFDK